MAPQLGTKASHYLTPQLISWRLFVSLTIAPHTPCELALSSPPALPTSPPLPTEMHPTFQVKLKCQLLPSPCGCLSLLHFAPTTLPVIWCLLLSPPLGSSSLQVTTWPPLSLQPPWPLDTLSTQEVRQYTEVSADN